LAWSYPLWSQYLFIQYDPAERCFDLEQLGPRGETRLYGRAQPLEVTVHRNNF
jgi:hypothetical protein